MTQIYDQLNDAGKRLARTPRLARFLALTHEDLRAALDSTASTLWHVYTFVSNSEGDESEKTGLLDMGLRPTEASWLGWHGELTPPNRKNPDVRRWQMRLARDMLAATAFEMFLGENRDGASPPLLNGVDRNLMSFQNRVFDRIENSGCYVSPRGKPLDGEKLVEQDWACLRNMNSKGLEYFVLNDFGGSASIKFMDRTVQTFFAAYWACRWADNDDRAKMRHWIPDPVNYEESAYREFWNMVIELREIQPKDENQALDVTRWEQLMSPLYDGTLRDNDDLPIRSTELIYRTWKRMKGTAARQLFQSEFPKLLESSSVAQGLISGFISLGNHDRKFEMGASADECPEWDSNGDKGQDNPLHDVHLKPYHLHRYCVTNMEYELFDDRHQSKREFEESGGDQINVDEHPVVNVTWYDACCFAKWLGAVSIEGVLHEICLPTEAQWEYACRCGKSTPFTLGAGLSGDKIESAYCNFRGDSPWAKPGTLAAIVGPDRHRTIGVDELGSNPWGFYQMHGNVGEWCHDWYSSDYYHDPSAGDNPQGPDQGEFRVLRGGCLLLDGSTCRSGYRLRTKYTPGRSRASGFRLAAVPKT